MKSDAPVKFTSELDMSSYCGKNKGDIKYGITAVVRHIGNNARYGHYICDKVVKNLDQVPSSLDTDQGSRYWKRCDDSVTIDVSEVNSFRAMYFYKFIKTLIVCRLQYLATSIHRTY